MKLSGVKIQLIQGIWLGRKIAIAMQDSTDPVFSLPMEH
jgi:hypothetical protein